MKKIIRKFIKAFDGYENAYGQHGNFKRKENGKMEGKAQTIISPLTDDIIKCHLEGGENGLGIVPLKLDDTAMFGAVDIDTVGVNSLAHTVEELEKKITSLGLPLIPCTTKSGGVHLYCFTQKPVHSSLMVKRLKEWAALLGYGSSEIFPKQTYRVNENDIGNWINLPYYDYKESKRVAVNKGSRLDIDQFLELVDVMRISESELNDFKLEEMDEAFDNAPPCLQILYSAGLDEGSRNNGLYNFAVYFKKVGTGDWQEKVHEVNNKIVNPALTKNETENVIKSVTRHNFFYKCNEYPLCQYCNKDECKKREFGIGKSSTVALSFENLTKYIIGNEVAWFAEYQGKRIQLTTEELLNQNKLQNKLVDVINKTFPVVKNSLWLDKVNELLINCTIVHEPIQASRKGQFFELLDSFLTDGVSGETKDDLLKYSTYIDGDSGLIFFRSFNLFTFLKNKRFKYTEQEIWIWMKEKKAKSQKIRIAKKTLNVWCIDAPEYFEFDTKQDEERI